MEEHKVAHMSPEEIANAFDFEQLTHMRMTLVNNVQSIQDQLSSRTSTEYRYGSQEYWDWRERAKYALKMTERSLRSVNVARKIHHERERSVVRESKLRAATGDPKTSAQALVYQLLKLVVRGIACGMPMHPEDDMIMEAAVAFVGGIES